MSEPIESFPEVALPEEPVSPPAAAAAPESPALDPPPADLPPPEAKADSDPVAEPPPPEPASSTLSEVTDLMHKHPVASVLTLVGAGLGIGLILREIFKPAPAKNQALAVLEDIQERLQDLTRNAGAKAAELAEQGTAVAKACAKEVGNLKRFFGRN